MVVGRLAGRLVVDQSTLFSYFHKISYDFDKTSFSTKHHFYIGFGPNRFYQNDRRGRAIISWFW